MKSDRTASTRQSRARQALAQSGGRTVTVKLDKASSDALAAICATGSDVQSAIRNVLISAAPQAHERIASADLAIR